MPGHCSSHSCTAAKVLPTCTPDVEALPAAMGAGAVDADAAVADGVQRAAAVEQHIAGVHPRVQLAEAPGRRVGLPDGWLPVHPHRLPTKGSRIFMSFNTHFVRQTHGKPVFRRAATKPAWASGAGTPFEIHFKHLIRATWTSPQRVRTSGRLAGRLVET